MSEEPSLLSTRFWQSINAVEKYARRRYRKWDQRVVSWREYKTVASFIEKYSIAPGKVLDIPAGYGRFTEFFLERDMEIFSADLNLYAMMYLRDRFLEVTKTTVSSVWRLPFRDNQFDLVFTFRLLDLFMDKQARINAVKELARVSKKWIIISFYTFTPLHSLTRLRSRTQRAVLRKRELHTEFKSVDIKLVECTKILPGLHAQTVCLFRTDN